MIKKTGILALTFILLLSILSGCGSEEDQTGRETIYQVALLQSLTQGYYDGIISVSDLRKHGDTGIGTFSGVNGEMILLDGVCYQADSEGKINEMPDSETVPFSDVTYFDEDGTVKLKRIKDIDALQTELDKIVSENGPNSFYMLKIDGKFSHIKVRSEYKQEKPYRTLDKALADDQTEFEYDNIKGTIVALYCPDYMSGLNTPGWHFHFIDSDHEVGGHVLDVNVKKATAAYDMTDEFAMCLSDESGFQRMDLSKDVDKAIEKVEKN